MVQESMRGIWSGVEVLLVRLRLTRMEHLIRTRAKLIHEKIWNGTSQTPDLDADADYEMEQQIVDRRSRSIDIIVKILKVNPKYLESTFVPNTNRTFLDLYFQTLLNIDEDLMSEYHSIADQHGISRYANLKQMHIQFDYMVDLSG